MSDDSKFSKNDVFRVEFIFEDKMCFVEVDQIPVKGELIWTMVRDGSCFEVKKVIRGFNSSNKNPYLQMVQIYLEEASSDDCKKYPIVTDYDKEQVDNLYDF